MATSDGSNITQALQNCAGTVSDDRNDNATIKRQSSQQRQQLMETCQGVNKTINDAAKASLSKLPNVKTNDDSVAINKSDKRSIDLQSISCQENVLPELSVTTDSQIRQGQGRGSKRKLNDLEDQSATTELDLRISNQRNQSKMSEGIKPRVKDTPTIFTLEKTARNRIRNGRVSMEGRPFPRRHASSSKYASFLRMFRKEEEEDLRGNSSSRRDDGEKLQHRRGLSAESTGYNRANPLIERRAPTPRSTVHTTYNPIMHSSTTDPILDSNGLTLQLLRLAVLLYAPALMPALNSLIAQQNQQMPVSPFSFEGSKDLLTQIFRLLNEPQSISNLPLVSLDSERVSSVSETAAEMRTTESSQTRPEQEEENISIATEVSPLSPKQESISPGTSRWNPNNRVQAHQQNERDRKWQLTSMLNDSNVRLDRNIFTTDDFRKFEEFLRAGKKGRSEDVRSLSTRSKNEIVMKEYFRDWLQRLLQQLNSTNSGLSANDQRAEQRSQESSGTTDESSLEEVDQQRNTGRLIVNESPKFLKNDENVFTEHEEEDDSDDQKSFTSATSTNSSRSLQFKQDDASKAESRNENTKD